MDVSRCSNEIRVAELLSNCLYVYPHSDRMGRHRMPESMRV